VNLVGKFWLGKISNQANFSKFSTQNVGSNLYEKHEKTEIDFIQNLRDIIPNRDQSFKDESSIFSTSINMSQNVQEDFQKCQNRNFLQIHRSFLEHIFKKSSLLKSLCRPSFRPSVCPSVRPSPISQPL
jgi:hypothetical protein